MRYAICYAPPHDSPLWRQGSLWLGRDARSGESLQQPCFRGIGPDILAETTRRPARYGFVASLVPPFRCHSPWREGDLVAALEAFAALQRPLALPALTLAQVDSFFCLRPVQPTAALHQMAAHSLRSFDRFRAPLGPSERARYKAALLSSQERRNLETWGYPYLFEQHRFHFTLTSRLAEGKHKARVLGALVETFGPLLGETLLLDALTLVVEPAFGQPMRCLHQAPLSGTAPESSEGIPHDQQSQRQNLYPRYQCRPA